MGCCFMEPSFGGGRHAENGRANYIDPIRGSGVNVYVHMVMKPTSLLTVCVVKVKFRPW